MKISALTHAWFRGDGIEIGVIVCDQIDGFWHKIYDIKRIHEKVWGFGLKARDSTDQASGHAMTFGVKYEP